MSTPTVSVDAIGQIVTPGDYVISIRDGTGAKPRMVLKFSPSKVLVSSSASGASSSYMDACSLVVITANMEKLIADGHQGTIDCVNQLNAKFSSQVEHTAPQSTPIPLRWVAFAYAAQYGGAIEFVSIHQVEGTTQAALATAQVESRVLGEADKLRVESSMSRIEDLGTLSWNSRYRLGNHWPQGYTSYKNGLFTHKLMLEIGLDNMEVNKLIPVEMFNNTVAPTHRITRV